MLEIRSPLVAIRSPFGSVGGAPTFTPASLILPGDVGGVMDASDLSSLYQESAGITTVTSDGDRQGSSSMERVTRRISGKLRTAPARRIG